MTSQSSRDDGIKPTGKVLKDLRGKIIARQFESPVDAGKFNWVYESHVGSELEFMHGCTIIALD